MRMNLISPLPVSVNEYLGKKVAFSCGKPYVQIYETTKAKQYKTYMNKVIARAMKEQDWVKPDRDKHIVVEGVFYMNKRRKDIDNCWKLILDTLVENGVVEDDDIILPVAKDVFIDPYNPRVELNIYLSDKIGVFADKYNYNIFITKNCSKCKRYDKNCSILKKCLENRIQEDIELETLTCKKIKPSA